MFEGLRHKLYSSPSARTAASIFSAVGIGVFSNTLVAEITTPSGIKWTLFYSTISFCVVVVLSILTFLYNRWLYLYESDIQNFRDIEFCMAYARSRLLPEHIERYRQQIRNGQMGDFRAAMDELRDALQ
jgi:hypothetical protein